MTTWLEDASANRHIKTYVKDFLDVSGNFTVRTNYEDYKWNSYGQLMSGIYESDGAVYSGITVDMDASGTTIAVGGHKDNTDGALGVIRVYRYDSDAEVWYQLGSNVISDTSIGLTFGWQGIFLSDDGTILAVNDYASTSSSGLGTAGKIYVFQYNADTNNWDNYGDNQTELEGTSASQQLGHRGVSMSGDGSTIAAGEQLNDHSVRIKKLVNGSWTSIGDTGVVGAANFDHARPSLNYDGSRVVFNDFSNQIAYVYEYSGSGTTWTQVGSDISNSGGNGTDSYTSMNKAGDIIAIHEQTNETVRIYQFVDTDWVQLGSTLSNSYGSSGYFGAKMRLNAAGDMIFASDYLNDTINIFKYQNYDWVQIGDPIIGIADSNFGRGCGISDDGTKIVAGGWLADLNGTNSGYVQAFQWSREPMDHPIMEVSGNTFTIDCNSKNHASSYTFAQLGSTLTGSNQSLGYSIAMNYTGDTMIAGQHQANSNAGQLLLYKYRTESWNLIATLDGTDSLRDKYLGIPVDINNDGSVVATGSHYASDSGTSEKGSILVYEYTNGALVQKGSTIDGNNGTSDYFGARGTVLNGDGTVVAGTSWGGYAKVFKYVEDSTNDWVQMGSDFTVTNVTLAINLASRPITLDDSGTIVAIASPDDDTTGTNNGKVDVYKFTGDVDTGSWNQLGSTIYGVARSGSTYEGATLKLSADGTILATGSWYYNSSNGYIRVFKYIEAAGDWCQMGADIQNNTSGAVSWARGFDMSSDGKTLAVGEANADDGLVGDDEGGTDIFKYINGQWVYIDHIASTYAVANTYLGKNVTISGDGKRFAAGSDTNPGIIEAWEITNTPLLEVANGTAICRNFTSTTSISAAYDTDITSYFGRAAIGYNGNIGYASFAHVDRNSTGDYALLQSSSGSTFVNCSTGQNISFRINNSDKMILNSSGYLSINTTSIGYNVEVNGGVRASSTCLFNGNVYIYKLYLDNNTGYWATLFVGSGKTYARCYFRTHSNGNSITLYAYSGSFSDDRLKKEEEYITNATETLMKLSVQKYKKYNTFECTGDYKMETGLIAQDIWYNAPELRHTVDLGTDTDASGNKIEPLPLPEGVNTTHDIQNDPDYNALGWGEDEAGVLYSQFIPYLVRSNQEQQEELDAQESQIKDLLARITLLENK